MGKRRTPRKPFWTLLGAGTIACGLTMASLVPLPTVHDTATQVRALPQGGIEVGDGTDPAVLFNVETYCDAAAERDYVTGVVDPVADRRCAARLIANRLDTQWWTVEEDWTWAGMPAIVGASNEALLDEWQAAGRPDASGWLDSYAATETWEI